MSHKAISFSHDVNVLDEAAAYELIDVDTPKPSVDEILVKVLAVSVNPVDIKMQSSYTDQTPRILGFDAVGEVVEIGTNVSQLAISDKVFYAGRQLSAGANQEYHLVNADLVAKAPKGLSNEAIASMPLTSITASEILSESFGLSITPDSAHGKSLLVINGAGGVGSILIQLAKYMGLQVITTASRPDSIAWVNNLGADLILNHRQDLDEQLQANGIKQVDYVAILHDTDAYLPLAVQYIAPFGAIASIVEAKHALNINPLKNLGAQFSWVFMFAKGNYGVNMATQSQYLAKIAELLDNKQIKTTTAKTYRGFSTQNLLSASRDVAKQSMIGKVVVTFDEGK